LYHLFFSVKQTVSGCAIGIKRKGKTAFAGRLKDGLCRKGKRKKRKNQERNELLHGGWYWRETASMLPPQGTIS